MTNPTSTISPRDQMIMQWQQAKAAADSAIALERDLRATIVANAWPVGKRKVGTNNLDLGNGVTLKGVLALTYKLDSADDSARTYAAEEAIEALGNEGAFIASRLIKWKPELSVSEYKALETEGQYANATHVKIKAIIDEVLTISDASPQVSVVYPKGR